MRVRRQVNKSVCAFVVSGLLVSGVSAPAVWAQSTDTGTEASSDIVVRHEPVACVAAGRYPRIDTCFEREPVGRAQVRFRANEGDPWYFVALDPAAKETAYPDASCYSAYLPKPEKGQIKQFQYYIDVVDQRTAHAAHPPGAPQKSIRAKVVAKSGDCVGVGHKVAVSIAKVVRPILVQLAQDQQLQEALVQALVKAMVPKGFSPQGVTNVASPSQTAQAKSKSPGGQAAAQAAASSGGGSAVMIGALAAGLASAGAVVARNAAAQQEQCLTTGDLVRNMGGLFQQVGGSTACTAYERCGPRLSDRICFDVASCSSLAMYVQTSDGQRFSCGTFDNIGNFNSQCLNAINAEERYCSTR